MKKLILSLVLILAGVAAVVATGDFNNNQLQSGGIALTTLTGNTWTNTFAIPYTVTPIVTITPTSTNGAPYSLTAVTSSNFVVASTANTPTNCFFYWSAQIPYTRIQAGTNTVVTAVPLVVTFASPYAYPPIVTGTFSTTNLNAIFAINVQSTTTTNFTILENLGGIASWNAIGYTFFPGATIVTY